MGGLLEGIAARQPEAARIKPVMAGGEYARHFAYGPYRRAARRSKSLGYNLIIRLDRYNWLAGHWPYEDWKKWEEFVGRQANAWGRRVIYDVWNEPGLPEYWQGSQEQYFETYVRAWRVLEEKLGPGVQVTGPSTHVYDRAVLSAFLDYCKAHGAKVPILNWHELTGTTASGILGNLRHAQKAYLQNSKYASLGLGRLMINETFPTEDAAAVVGIFWALETGGAAGAVNSCFGDDCEKATLSGLLATDAGRQPRSSWHVYAAYAGGVKTRVSSTTNNPKIPALGSAGARGKTGMVQVLLGYDATAKDAATAKITLDLRQLGRVFPGPEVEAIISRLDNSGNAVSPGFVEEKTERLPLRGGNIVLAFTLSRQDVLLVQVRAAK